MGREGKLGLEEYHLRLTITDMDFADDIVLVSEDIKGADEMLKRVELSAKCIGLNMNKDKTKYMSSNNDQHFNIKTIDETILKRVDDFKYLGSWVDSSEKDVKIRKPRAWRTCHQMRNIWKSTNDNIS